MRTQPTVPIGCFERPFMATARLVVVGLVLLVLAAPGSRAFAHAGHDHGEPPTPIAAAHPRITIVSEIYELVGILRNGRLSVFLDRFATNEPVTGARIAVSIGDQTVNAVPAGDGTYTVESEQLKTSIPVELVFSITAPEGDDLVIGMLTPAAPPGVAAQAVPLTLPLSHQNSVLLFLLLLAVVFTVPLAGGGSPGGNRESEGKQTSVARLRSRVVARSKTYELGGILHGARLSMALCRAGSGAVVPDAIILVCIGEERVLADPAPDGTYVAISDRFLTRAGLELLFAVRTEDGDDLLLGSLAAHEKSPAGSLDAPASPVRSKKPLLLAATLACGIVLGFVIRGIQFFPALMLVAGLLFPGTASGQHGHGVPSMLPLSTGDTPRRLPEGSVFVPKPTQRLLEIRTSPARPGQAQRAVNLMGRIIADPNRSGLVQSLGGGRVIAPEAGLPNVGQTVRRGDILAEIERPLPSEERVNLSERSGEIEQQIAIVETKLRRVRQLAEKSIAPQSQVTDAEVELEGLRRRREIIRKTRAEPEILRAPGDGVIASARITPGQVVQAQDALFQIVDPKHLWVEALVHGELDPAAVGEASAIGPAGEPMRLLFRGFSRTLQQHAAVVQFAIENPPPTLGVGLPLTVVAKSGTVVEGIILPREAIVRSSVGESLVWRHAAPERFEALAVLVEPFDAARILVRSGVKDGERVVVRGAELINQIR